MTITITKKKNKIQKVVEQAQSGLHEAVVEGLEASVDPLYHAQIQMDVANTNYKAKKKAYDLTLKEFMGLFNQESHAPDEPVDVMGEEGMAIISKEGTARKVMDTKTVFHMLEEIKEGLGFELMNFKLTDLDKYFDPDEQELVMEKNFTGKRTVKTASRGIL